MRKKKGNVFVFNAKVIIDILIIMEVMKRNSQALYVSDPCLEVTQRYDLCSRSRIKHSRVRKLVSKPNKIKKGGKIKATTFFQDIIYPWAQVVQSNKVKIENFILLKSF